MFSAFAGATTSVHAEDPVATVAGRQLNPIHSLRHKQCRGCFALWVDIWVFKSTVNLHSWRVLSSLTSLQIYDNLCPSKCYSEKHPGAESPCCSCRSFDARVLYGPQLHHSHCGLKKLDLKQLPFPGGSLVLSAITADASDVVSPTWSESCKCFKLLESTWKLKDSRKSSFDDLIKSHTVSYGSSLYVVCRGLSTGC